ncbi:hypothetical protein E1180_07775 [Roseibium denhamense]|uniref:DUF768 domain-containing protein n=1 Tax=Roseibium denhamense TaxID=76305 RepID=A0ABY1NVJ7_9HYPH|nr:hypothetical protein [Roseibium denhamense]MTI05413.1 hypothetical protein [Roseibium denhamense]SMP18044.1 hypothetical protein SAMN06265374_1868 [Roseibium denhamense]
MPNTPGSKLNIKIPFPEKPEHVATAIVAYAGIAKRLHVELAAVADQAGIDLDTIKADLMQEAKKAVPHGDFTENEIGIYETMFEAIETIFDTGT